MSSSSEAEFSDAYQDEEEAFDEEDGDDEEDFIVNDNDGDDDDDYSSDDDAPLSSMKKNSKSRAKDDDDDDDDSVDSDEPLSSLKSKKASPKKKAATKKKKAKTPVAKKKTKAKTATKKKTPAKKKTTTTTASTSSNGSSDNNYRSASAAFYGSGCKKGLLVQRLLCRWWYAMEWPDPSSLPDKTPKHYDAMDGFPGVYVCTSGDNVGDIKDYRNMEACPNFNNFAKKPASELQTMLTDALIRQKELLIKHEGKGTAPAIEKEIDAHLKWAQKLKPDAVDKEAVKVLKAAKLKLT
mmetsp:Transcript_19955/g.30824  ORF Transcript_19955/g.30824 Transcript_19955/m.30824 type:complete len:295 (-) Transcript_19955:5838-6722(-)